METCKRCHVQVEISLTHCPVCGSFVRNVLDNDRQSLYPNPNYSNVKKQTANTIRGVFALPLLLLLLLTLLVDFALIAFNRETTFFMTFVIFYVWILIYKTFDNRQGIGDILSWQLVGLSTGTMLLAFVNQQTFDAWPLQFVVPSLIAISNLSFFMLATIRRKTDILLLQMFVTGVIGVAQFSLMIWVIESTVLVPSFIAGFTSLLSFTALLTYLRTNFINFIQRWFHI